MASWKRKHTIASHEQNLHCSATPIPKGPKTTKSRAPNSLRSLEEAVLNGFFLPRCFLENCSRCLRQAEIRVCWWGEQMFITDISSDYGEQSQITELEHVAAKSSKQFG